MPNQLQIRRGIKANLPTLASGEPGWCTDTYELYIGTGSANKFVGGSSETPMTNPMTAAHDIIVGGTGGTPTRLAVAEQRIVGRGGGNIDDLTASEVLDMVSTTEGHILQRGAALWAGTSLPKNVTTPQTVHSAFTDAHGFPDFLWSGQEDFAPMKVPAGDAISGGNWPGWYAYNAFNGTNIGWASLQVGSAVNGVAYLGLKNLKRNIGAIKFLNYSVSGHNQTSVKIDYSTDGGVTWTNIQTTTVVNTANSWNEFSVAAYAAGNAGLHSLRILANSNCDVNHVWVISTLIFLYSPDFDVCTTGNGICYDENVTHTLANAWDNVESTYYQSNTNMNTGNCYVGQTNLSSSLAVKAIRFKYYSATYAAKEVTISWKNSTHTNKTAWSSGTDLATVALDAASVWQTIKVPSYFPSSAHSLVLRPTTNCAAQPLVVYEMEFYTSIDDAISMTASTTDPLILVHSSGTDNYVTEVTSSEASLVSSLVPGRTHFIYVDRNPSTGAITYDSKPVCPQYGKEFDATKHSLLHFEGANNAQTTYDEYGQSTTLYGNAKLDNNATPGPKFGSTYLRLDGSGDYCVVNSSPYNGQPFTIEGWWFTADQATANQAIFSAWSGVYPIAIYYSAANTFSFFASSNNSSYDIASFVHGQYVVANNTWYKFIFEWDGYYYRLWWGTSTATMQLIINVKSSVPIFTGAAAIQFGSHYAGSMYFLNGGLDEIRITLGSNRYGWSPVAETSAFDKYDSDMTYFDINKMKMYHGGGSSWTEVQRLFLGEAYMDCHGVTDMRNYALQGKYASPLRPITASTHYYFNHNLGSIGGRCKARLINLLGNLGWRPGEVCDEFMLSAGGMGADASITNRKIGHMGTGANISVMDRSTTSAAANITAANWGWQALVERGW